MNNSQNSSNRIIYFDYLRIIAISAVMVLHIAGQNWRSVDVGTADWMVFNIADSVVRWGVPVFVMISGALLLGTEKPITTLYKKNVLRIAIALVVWSMIYVLVAFYQQDVSGQDLIRQIVNGHFHLWFLYMIIGLYIISPLLRQIVLSELLTKYFLGLCVVITFLLPQLSSLMAFRHEFGSGLLSGAISHFSLTMPLGYVGYFILGYWLNKIRISVKTELIIYILGLLGFIFTITATAYLSRRLDYAVDILYNNLTCNILLESVAVFVFAKKHLSNVPRRTCGMKWLLRLSSWSFGAYLVHALILEELNLKLGLNTRTYSAPVSLALIFVIVFVASFLISGILNQIPGVKKIV